MYSQKNLLGSGRIFSKLFEFSLHLHPILSKSKFQARMCEHGIVSEAESYHLRLGKECPSVSHARWCFIFCRWRTGWDKLLCASGALCPAVQWYVFVFIYGYFAHKATVMMLHITLDLRPLLITLDSMFFIIWQWQQKSPPKSYKT